MLEVVTVWAPRPNHPKWRDYLSLLALQARTVKRVGHRHVVVTDTELKGYNTFQADLPDSLLHALIAGQLAYMRQWSGKHRVVLADMDCMVINDLNPAFTGFDVGLTIREHDTQPIQNGAMYFEANERAKAAAVAMLDLTLGMCGREWGEDQEALARAVEPPGKFCTADRFGAKFAFLPIDRHNHSNKHVRAAVDTNRFIEHFKGDMKKWAEPFVKRLCR